MSLYPDTFTMTQALTKNVTNTALPVPCAARLIAVYMNATTAPTTSATAVTVYKNGTTTGKSGNVALVTGKGSILPVTDVANANTEIDADDTKGAHATSNTYSSGVTYGVIGTNYIRPIFPSGTDITTFAAGDTIALAVANNAAIAGLVATMVFETL